MSRRERRAAGERGPVETLPPPLVRPETIRTVIDAVDALDRMGAAAFERLLAGYRDVCAAKGETFAYAWMAYELDRNAGPTAVRAIACAGVVEANRRRDAESMASAAHAVRVEWLRHAVGRMADRYAAAASASDFLLGNRRAVATAGRRFDALHRLIDALAREAS